VVREPGKPGMNRRDAEEKWGMRKQNLFLFPSLRSLRLCGSPRFPIDMRRHGTWRRM
jgi:hypothetical protein